MKSAFASTTCAACGYARELLELQGLCPACLLRGAFELLAPPATIAEYRVIRELGRGAMGTVYLGMQPVPQKRVAIKVIRQEPIEERALWLFREEIEILGRLEHPNIVPIYDGRGLHHSPPFFVMRWIDGGTLEDPALSAQYRDPKQAALLMITIANAVQFAHQRGVLHRDLKPGNVLIAHDGTPYVSDFGVAKLLGSDEPALTETVAGSLGFMSPEQAHAIDRPVTITSDVYGLGALFYQLLTGRPPRDARDLGQLVELFKNTEPPKPRQLVATIPRDLERICLCALERDPSTRYRSAAEFADDLRRVLDQRPPQPPSGRPPSAPVKLAYWVRRHKLAAAACIQLCLLLVYIGLMPLVLVREVEGTIRQQNAFSAIAQAGAVMSELHSIEAKVAALSRAPGIHEVVHHEDIFTPPMQFQGRASNLDAIYGLAVDGVLRARTPKPLMSVYEFRNFGFRDYFRAQQRLVAGGVRDVYVARAIQSVGDKALMLGFSAPLFDEANQFVGVLCAAVKARATFGAVQMNCSGNGDCMTALLGPRDRDRAEQPLPDSISVLAAPGLADGEEKYLDAPLGRRLCARLGCAPSDRGQFDMRPRAAPLVIDDYRDPISHVTAIAAFAPVGRTGLIVLVATPASAVRALTDQMTGHVKAFLWAPLLLGCLLFGLLMWFPSARTRA